MKIVLQCEKCGAISIDDWVRVGEDGEMSFRRFSMKGKKPSSAPKLENEPYCHSCGSKNLIIGHTHFSGLNIP